MFAALAGGNIFSKIDLSRAYQQVAVEVESRQYSTLNTHKGLYQVKCLAFGVASPPSIFKIIMDSLVKGLTSVTRYLDDILVMGHDEKEHLENLDSLLNRLSDGGVRNKRKKCDFLKRELHFLGHIINDKRISTVPDKVKAATDAPAPKRKKQLKSFLGMVTYYGKFLPELSTVLFPLNRLLCKNVLWRWSKQCEEDFQTEKAVDQSSGARAP